jgi:hypothetical protein
MLAIQAIETALPLAERCDRAGVIVLPVTNTPLDLLVRATRSDTQFAVPVDGKLGEYQPSVYDIEYIANKVNDATGVCEHNVTMDHLVELGANAVRQHLYVVRNLVKPAVLDLAQKVGTALDNMPAGQVLGLELKIFDLPAPMKNPALDSLTSKFEETPLASPSLNVKCPDIQMDELRELLHTGAKSLDSDIDQWIAVKGDSWFLQLWEDIFTTKNSQFSKFADAVNCREEGYDRALAIFLIARKLFEDPIEGIPMSLPSFKSAMAEFRNQAAAKLARAASDWATTKKNGIIVRRSEPKSVTVNECVYREWIKDGGSNELLFANLLKKTGFVGIKQILAQAGTLQAFWNQQVAYAGSIERSQRFVTAKSLFLSEFRKQLADAKGEQDGPDAGAYDRAHVESLFKAELAKLKESDLDDLHCVALKLLCRSRFYKTDAEDFLTEMETITKENPMLSPREVASLAAVEYICCWVAEMFNVTRVNRV